MPSIRSRASFAPVSAESNVCLKTECCKQVHCNVAAVLSVLPSLTGMLVNMKQLLIQDSHPAYVVVLDTGHKFWITCSMQFQDTLDALCKDTVCKTL